MRWLILILALMATPAAALNEGLQCVPYARAVSGIAIRGDAHTWWAQAADQYQRGTRPRAGAVLALKPHGTMQLGHVAAVRKIIDNRNILVSHANWSTIEGRRGHIEENVRVVDVSDAGDWSLVRVWYGPLNDLGTTHYPVSGFIYPTKTRGDRDVRLAVAQLTGNKNGFTAAPTTVATAPVRQAVRTATLSFSTGLLNEINHRSAKEQKLVTFTAPPEKPAKSAANKTDRNPIDDIMASLGN